MILPNMTPEEMVSSVVKDEEIVARKINQLVASFGKPCRQARSFPYVQCHEYRTSHGQCNSFLVFLYASRRSEWDHPQVGAMCLYSTPEGYGAVMRCRVENLSGMVRKHYMIFTPHFVKRYAERCLGDIMADEKKVLRALFSDEGDRMELSRGTDLFVSRNGRNAGKEDIFVAPLSRGAAIVDRRNGPYSKFVTYLSESQFGNNQRAFLRNSFAPFAAGSYA